MQPVADHRGARLKQGRGDHLAGRSTDQHVRHYHVRGVFVERYTIQQSINDLIAAIGSQCTPNTLRSYKTGLKAFCRYLMDIGIDSTRAPISTINDDLLVTFFVSKSALSASTTTVYLAAISHWIEFLNQKGLFTTTPQAIKEKTRPYLPKLRRQESTDTDLSSLYQVIDYAYKLDKIPSKSEAAKLRNLRDRVLILLLAESGLDIQVISTLRIDQVDLSNQSVKIADNEGSKIVSFGQRTKKALEDYFTSLGQKTRSVKDRYVFGHHRMRSSDQRLPLYPRTIHKIVRQRAIEALGSVDGSAITPVSFKKANLGSFLNALALLHPKILSVCRIPFESGQYDDAIFDAMKFIEDEIRTKISAQSSDFGGRLLDKAFLNESVMLIFSAHPGEQKAAEYLYYGALGYFRNPRGHRFLETLDPHETFETLAFASLLLHMLDETGRY